MPARKRSTEPQADVPEEFLSACEVTKHLIEAGKLRVRVVYPARVDLRVSREDADAAAEAAGIAGARCRDIMRSEIAPLMAAILSEDRSILMMLVSTLGAGASMSDAMAKVKAREDVVKRDLVGQRLRERYLLKQTSKTNPLTGWHWEINRKDFDDAKGALPSLCHATVRLHAHRRVGRYDETSSDIGFPFLQMHSVEAFAFDCDLEEAEDLRDTFDKVARELRERGEEGHGGRVDAGGEGADDASAKR